MDQTEAREQGSFQLLQQGDTTPSCVTLIYSLQIIYLLWNHGCLTHLIAIVVLTLVIPNI